MADTPQPTKRAAAFMAANAVSPVVEGRAFEAGGCKYILQDGVSYTLSQDDCRSMPMPRWLHDVR